VFDSVAGRVRETRRRVHVRAIFERAQTAVSFDQRVRRIQNENVGLVERNRTRLVREISDGEKRFRVHVRKSNRTRSDGNVIIIIIIIIIVIVYYYTGILAMCDLPYVIFYKLMIFNKSLEFSSITSNGYHIIQTQITIK